MITLEKDRLLIDKSINSDGLILRPGNSMKPINSEMQRKARNDWDGPASQEPGENLHIFGNRFGAQIWSAKSKFGKFEGSAVLYASLLEDYETTAKDLEMDSERNGLKLRGIQGSTFRMVFQLNFI